VTEQRDYDEMLVERAKAGDQSAFGLLVEKYRHRVIRLVMRFARDFSTAEDLVQETFIRAYRALPTFRGDSEFFTWLYRIAVNVAKSHLNAVSKREAMFITIAPDVRPSSDEEEQLLDECTPELILIGKQMAQAVEAAVDKLPFDLWVVLSLREVDGLSYDEIANILMWPIGTVRSRIFRAREAIAQHLEART
jgi:RNA polymerase sigma-70 factor (ECF subfamily)